MSDAPIDVDAELMELALRERQERIDRLEKAGAVWSPEGRYWGLAGRAGRADEFYDEDGELM